MINAKFVLFSCFWYVILVGFTYTMGVFLDPLIKYYDSDTSTVSWVGSLFVGMEYMAGPIVGGLMNKFGLQKARIYRLA